MYNSVLKNNFDFASLLMNLLVLVSLWSRPFFSNSLYDNELKDKRKLYSKHGYPINSRAQPY